MMTNWLMLLAQDNGGPAPAEPSMPPWASPLILIIPFLVIAYFIIWRPQRQEQKKRQEMLQAIKKNDRVMTIGGIYATVVSVKEDEVVVKVDEANNTKLTLSRTAIRQILQPKAAAE